jgi:ABC-type multidrug transport system ATPase subunit
MDYKTTMTASNHSADVEKDAVATGYTHLTNETVRSFSWNNVTVTVKDRVTKQPIDILSGINGIVEAGEVVALMGPRHAPTTIPTSSIPD